MFYEESQIAGYLNCPKCLKRYDEPKILPCGKIICNTCINSFSGVEKLMCPFCNEAHQIPKKGLPVCELRLNLLLTTPEEVYRGKNVEDLKQALKNLILKTQQLNQFLKNGTKHIQTYCNNLRLDVQSATEKIIKQINQFKFSLIDKINVYEKKSIILFEINKLDRSLITDHFREKFDAIEKFHLEWSNYLKKPKIKEESVLKAIGQASERLKQIEELNVNEVVLSKNVLKFNGSGMERILDETFLGGLKFQIDFNALKTVDFSRLIVDIKESKFEQASYIDFLGDGLFFTAYQDKSHCLKFSVLNDAKSVIESYVHEPELIIFNHFMTNQAHNLILVDYGYNGLFRVFDKKLQVIKEVRLENMDLKGSNESYIYLTCSNAKKETLHIYDWSLRFVKSVGQGTNPNGPFYFPTNDEKGIWQIDCRDNKYFWLNENHLHIVDESSGMPLKLLNTQASKFNISTAKKLLLVHDGVKRVKYYDFNGILLNEINFNNFSNGLMFDFLLDNQNDLICFANLHRFCLYQLDNYYNVSIIEKQAPVSAD